MDRDTFPHRKADIWYEMAKDALDRQLSFVIAVDAKLAGLLGSGSALLGILTAVYALRPNAISNVQVGALAVSVTLYGGLAIASVAAVWSRTWGTGPDLRELEQEATDKGYDDEQIRWRATSIYVSDAETNEGRHTWKVRGLRVALICLVMETCSVSVGLLSLVGHSG